jgi:fructose-1,6-bisphosphatase/inositol monophosphatase family enzyme
VSDTLAASFVRVTSPALRQAAAIARALEGRVANRPKGGEGRAAKAALTIADTAAQEAILVPLLEHFAEFSLDAEEDTPSVHGFRGLRGGVVVLDPIDGTLHSYLERKGPYAVVVGLAVRGTFAASLTALPREGLFFDAVRGRGARVARAGGAPRRARLSSGARRVLVSHEMPEAVRDRLRERDYEVSPACGGAIAVAPLIPGVCGGLRLASGVAKISRRGRVGALIAEEAGAVVRREGFAPFPREIDAPARALLVAATEEDAAQLAWSLEAEG